MLSIRLYYNTFLKKICAKFEKEVKKLILNFDWYLSKKCILLIIKKNNKKSKFVVDKSFAKWYYNEVACESDKKIEKMLDK